ncbi:MAG: coproporphyrinogen III oxidase family protein [Deltaproteobacteria bacterium]|nr:coproporphyrinogen III oxidase family protein [Deltaproteobacteria bacterium]
MSNPEPATSLLDSQATEVGSVFVSNYPPYSFWSETAVPEVHRVLGEPPRPNTPLGLYLHIPFCRKRCKFCYFRVYTDKNASQVEEYIGAVVREARLYAEQAALSQRPVNFVYFGGGTPSFISVKHLKQLVEQVQEVFPWDQVEEVAFECEPGTLTRSKLEAIKEIGVTRLSLGVEHFDDEILRENGRAHVSKEIYRVLPWITDLGFDQLNIDLIAGLVGETWDSWRGAIDKTLEVSPDSVTIYQLELPYNTVYSKSKLAGDEGPSVADWQTKRQWQAYAMERLGEEGYEVSSAYTMVKKKQAGSRPFVYRDALWQGADLLPLGVSSFGHLSGVHFQNLSGWTPYLNAVGEGELPISRAFVTTADERLTREMILQLKRGYLLAAPFQEKFGVDIRERFAEPFGALRESGLLKEEQDHLRLSPEGLLRVDQLLPAFYDVKYQGARYT